MKIKIRKNIIIVIFISIMLIVVVLTTVLITTKIKDNQYNNEKEMTILKIDTDEKFPVIKLVDVNNKEAYIFNNNEQYSIYFYMSKNCSACMEELPKLERLMTVLGNENYLFRLLWKDSIPKNELSENDIDLSINYSMNGKSSLDINLGSGIIIDKQNKIIFSNGDLNNVFDKIMNLDTKSNELAQKSAAEYMRKKNENSDIKNKPYLIYFAMKGCKDCEAANPIYEDVQVQKRYNCIKVWSEDSEITDKEAFIDIGDFLFHSFRGEWYPSFLIVDGNATEFIGEISINDLKDKLLKKL